MADPLDDDLITAKSVFGLVGGATIIGGILLFNTDTQSVWGIMKGVAGLGLWISAFIGGWAFYKGL